MSPQSRNEYLLEKVAERLGVPKPDGQVAFLPDPLGLLQSLVQLLADPAAAKKRVAEFADAVAKAGEATDAAKKAQADRDRAYAEIEAAQKRHDDKLAAELAEHSTKMHRRELEVEQKERTVSERERIADNLIAELKADRAKLDKKLAAIRNAATD